MLVSKLKQNLKGQDKLKHSMYGNLIFFDNFPNFIYYIK